MKECVKGSNSGGGGGDLSAKEKKVTSEQQRKNEIKQTEKQHSHTDEQLKDTRYTAHRNSESYTRYLQQQQKYTKVYKKEENNTLRGKERGGGG